MLIAAHTRAKRASAWPRYPLPALEPPVHTSAVSSDRLASFDKAEGHEPEQQLELRAVEPTRRPRRRVLYRSRNCTNIKRYGNFFQGCEDGDEAACGARRRGRHRGTVLREQILVDEMLRLQSQVSELQQRRIILESAMLDSKNRSADYALEVTRTFYEMFSYGFHPDKRPVRSHKAERFLRSTMTEDVVCTEFRGVDMFLRQYEASSRSHASMRLKLQRVMLVDHGDDATVQVLAEALARFRVSRETLERFFPSIVQDEVVTQQLIGKEYVLQYDKVFHFRRDDGRIFQHESRIDMCSSLMQMVGDPILVMKLLEASLLTKHGHWKLDNQIEENRHEVQNAVL